MYPTPAFERKLCPPEQFAERVAQLPRPLVFTNGCFDVLHRGHVTYLAQARALGASLIVGVNSDASVKRLGKDGDRPVNPLPDRMAVLAALESVSLVVEFDEDTPDIRKQGRINDGRRLYEQSEERGERGGERRERRSAPRDYARPAAAPQDPFFNKPYEAPAAEAAPAWEPTAKPASRLSDNIKPKRKVAALFKSNEPTA